jgi:hypothetical protein
MKTLLFTLLLCLGACQPSQPAPTRWQQGYEDGCLHARGASKEQCEARAAAIDQFDADYRAGWIEGYEACKFGPDGC